MNSTPIARVTCSPNNAGPNSQRVIHHGMSPASTHGATTKKSAEPKTAVAFCMANPPHTLGSLGRAGRSANFWGASISAVNATGAFWYDVYSGKFNAKLFISKLKAFLHNRRRPVFLVLDGHPAHRAKIVAAYVQSLEGRLELHFLPGYAPDLNPDEFVWNHL